MKRHRVLRRWLLWLGLLALAGFVGLNVLAYNHAAVMTHFAAGGAKTQKSEKLSPWARLKVLMVGVNLPRPVSELPPSALSADGRALAIPVAGNVTLSAWYADRGPATPLVILFHGYGSEKTSLLGEAQALLDLGASVLLVDFRGSGGSSESYTTIGVREAEDVAAAVRYARGNTRHAGFILFGYSMGAAAILRAISARGVAPDAVILEAVFDSLLNTARNRFAAMRVPSFPGAELLVFWGGWQWGFNGFRHNPVDYARAVNCPALFMHGRDDPRARLAEARRVFDAVPGPKEFVEFERTGHESYLATHPDEWRAAVSGFLK